MTRASGPSGRRSPTRLLAAAERRLAERVHDIPAAAVIAGVGVGAAMFGAGQASADVPQCYADQTAVASVDTVDAAATVCRWNDDGSLFYRGVTKSSGDTIDIEVSLVVLTGDGSGRYSYTAVNDGYTYRVDDANALAVTDPDGTVIFFERQI